MISGNVHFNWCVMRIWMRLVQRFLDAVASLEEPFVIDSITNSLIHGFSNHLICTFSLVRWSNWSITIQWFIHPFIHSYNYLFIHSLVWLSSCASKILLVLKNSEAKQFSANIRKGKMCGNVHIHKAKCRHILWDISSILMHSETKHMPARFW